MGEKKINRLLMFARQMPLACFFAGSSAVIADISQIGSGKDEDFHLATLGYPSSVDPLGKRVFQLSNTAEGDNFSLPYHDNSFTEIDGKPFLVFRNRTKNTVLNTLHDTYYGLELLARKTFPITPSGLANGGFVRGRHLYAFYRSDVARPFDRVVRFEITGNHRRADVCSLDAGFHAAGSVTVNSDESKLIFVQEKTPPGEEGKSPMNSFRQAVLCDLAGKKRRVIIASDGDMAPTDGIEHFQFSPTDPNFFQFVDKNRARSPARKERVALGWIGIGDVSDIQARIAYLHSGVPALKGVQKFPHPFFDRDGALMSDATYQDRTGQSVFRLIKFRLDPLTFGRVAGIDQYDLGSGDNTPETPERNYWQGHFSSGPTSLAFVGDGNLVRLKGWGTGSINKLLHAPQTGAFKQIPLASNIGATNNTPGTIYEANARFIPLGPTGTVIWSAYRTLNVGEKPDEAVFSNQTPVMSTNQQIFAVPY